MIKKKKTGKSAGPPTFDPEASRSQWLKGVLEICLLSLVSNRKAYGYEISQQLKEAGFGTIKSGTLYPRLVAMERAGLLELEWQMGDSGPGRKYYSATPAGLAALEESRMEYERFVGVVQALLGTTGSDIASGHASQDTTDPVEALSK